MLSEKFDLLVTIELKYTLQVWEHNIFTYYDYFIDLHYYLHRFQLATNHNLKSVKRLIIYF